MRATSILGAARLCLLVGMLAGSVLSVAAGQEETLSSRAPRFLVATAGARAVPVEVGASGNALLRRVVALRVERSTIGNLLAAIERQTGVRFGFSGDVVPTERVVTLRADSITVGAALLSILMDTGVDVVLSGRGRVALVERVGGPIVRQVGSITGRVTDEKTSDGLAGAEVLLEGTRWRTVAREDGRYQLAEVTPGSYTLTVRRVGYAKQSRAVTVVDGQELTINVVLQPVATQLNEIVTTVTGEQRRVELGHVVGRINADSLVKEAPVSSLSELLTGRVPGLQVTQAQGTVGGQVVLQVRGPNSFRLSNQPIIVVDGVRYTNEGRHARTGGAAFVEPSSPLNDLNVNDIESIEVVKGPSAATLYGTDAANGVLVITTKRGRPGPARWSAYGKGTSTEIPTPHFPDIYWGWGTVDGTPNSASVSCTLRRMASGQCTQQDSVTVLSNPLNNPQYSIFGRKPRWEYGMNVGGGQQDLRYFFSADLEDAAGPLRMPPAVAERLIQQRGAELPEEWREPNAFTKLNLRSNLTSVLGKTAELRVSAGYVKSDTRTLTFSDNPYIGAYFSPTPSSSDSPYAGASSFDPAQALAQTVSDQVDRFLGSANGNWQPAPWLAVRATLGVDLTNSRLYGLVRPGDQPDRNLDGAVEDTRSRQIATTLDLGATATARRGRLSARTAVGAQYVRSLFTSSQSVGYGLPPGASVPQRALTTSTEQGYAETVVLGGYAEEMLGLNERLFLTGALRMDGASTFGRGYDATTYPKVGASWLLSEEPFLPRVPELDELRLRYAYGASGRQPDPASARPQFAAFQTTLDGQVVNAIGLGDLGNAGLRPERVREHEFGFDATALANRVALEVTWFRRRTADQIVNVSVAPGLGGMDINLGLTTQRGFEAQLRARVVDTRQLSWDLVLQHADFSTKLEEIGEGFMSRVPDGGYVEGYPLGGRWIGRPPVSWEDLNGDGIIARSEVVRDTGFVYAGQSIPPRSQTLTTVVGLFQRRLRVSALLERKSGFTQINGLHCIESTCRDAVDPSTPFADQVRALNIGGPAAEKGDFTRLREVTAALDLPVTLLRAIRVRQGTLTVSARNLALWTDFSGADPEGRSLFTGPVVGPVSGGTASGIPQSRGFSVRLDLGL